MNILFIYLIKKMETKKNEIEFIYDSNNSEYIPSSFIYKKGKNEKIKYKIFKKIRDENFIKFYLYANENNNKEIIANKMIIKSYNHINFTREYFIEGITIQHSINRPDIVKVNNI